MVHSKDVLLYLSVFWLYLLGKARAAMGSRCCAWLLFRVLVGAYVPSGGGLFVGANGVRML